MEHSSEIPESNGMQQQLWDYVYGLLDEREGQRIRELITSDPEIARQYILVKMQTELAGEAARLPHPPIALSAVDLAVTSSISSDAPTPAASIRRRQHSASAESPSADKKWGWLNLVVYAATVLLVVGVGFYYLRSDSFVRATAVKSQQENLRRELPYTIMTLPERLHPGIDNKISVQTVGMDENPLLTQVEYRLLDSENKTQYLHVGKTDKKGRLHLAIPGAAVSRGHEFELVTRGTQGSTTIRGPITVDESGESVYLSTDRPIYKQGETVRFRGVVLSRFGLKVRREKGIEFDVRDARGRLIPRSLNTGVTRRGVGFGQFVLPKTLPVGRYELCARSPTKEFKEQRQLFYVRPRRPSNWVKRLEFTRPQYRPGDLVVADFSVRRAAGAVLSGATISVAAKVDGVEIHRDGLVTDEYGTSQIRFTLPEKITSGAAQIVVNVEQPGVSEQYVRTIPLRLNRVRIKFYPEGGDLVSGIASRVYFQCTDPLGRPVAVSGKVMDAKGKDVTNFKSSLSGRGQFRLPPTSDPVAQPYKVRLADSSAQVEATVPHVNPQAFLVVEANEGVVEAKMPIELSLRTQRTRAALGLNASCRGVTVGQQTVTIEPDKVPQDTKVVQKSVVIPLADEASGVIRVTVFDYSSTPPLPIAERLVFRRPEKRLKTTISRPTAFTPTRRAQVDLLIQDEQRRPVKDAVLGVTIVDRSGWQQSHMQPQDIASHFLLHQELQSSTDVATEARYLVSTASSNEQLDLLLGTKGWRRFIRKPSTEQLAEMRIEREERTSAPVVFNNRNRVYMSLLTSLDAFHTRRESNVQQLGWIVGVAAAGLLLLVLIQSILVRHQPRFVRPTVCVVSCVCLLLGICWASSRANPDGSLRILARFSQPAPTNDRARITAVNPQDGLPRFRLKPHKQDGPTYLRQLSGTVASKHWLDVETTNVFEGLRGSPIDGHETQGSGQGNQPFMANSAQTASLSRMQKRLRRALLNGEDEKIITKLSSDIHQAIEKNQFPIRHYAHRFSKSNRSTGKDHTRTLFWNPLVVTDKDGRASLNFDLSELTGTWYVLVDGHAKGRLASVTAQVESQLPFQLLAGTPKSVTVGDKFELPMQLQSRTTENIPLKVQASLPPWLSRVGRPPKLSVMLKPEETATRNLMIQVTGAPRKPRSVLDFAASSGRTRRRIQKSVQVLRDGYPNETAISGTFAGKRDIVFRTPQNALPGSLQIRVIVYPSLQVAIDQDAASLVESAYRGLEYVAAAGYSQAAALARRESLDLASPEGTSQVKQRLRTYYNSMLQHEHQGQGFWTFRNTNRNPVITAYGLLQLHEMQRVWPVDSQVLQRNSGWLNALRAKNNSHFTSSTNVPKEMGHAYVVWVLSEMKPAGVNLDASMQQVIKSAKQSQDPYLLSLAAASATNFERRQDADKLVRQLAAKQNSLGFVEAKQGTITRSGGKSMRVETTALATLAWLKHPATRENARRAIQWIKSQRQPGGGFGSSQATALAVRALASASQDEQAAYMGHVNLFNRGSRIGHRRIRANQREPIVFELSPQDVSMRDQSLQLTTTAAGSALPELSYTFHMRYHTAQPPQPQHHNPIKLATQLAQSVVPQGELVNLHVSLLNSSPQEQATTVVEIGLPGGLVASDTTQSALAALQKKGVVDSFEFTDRGIVLAWESLGGQATKTALRRFQIPLLAQIKGTFTGSPSRNYLNYHREVFQWVPPLQITVR